MNAQGGRYDRALQAAASRGHIEIARLLLDKGADVNTQGGHYGNALQAALIGGDIQDNKNHRLLLPNRADGNGQGLGNNALLQAASRGHTEMARLLLDKGVDVNALGGY